MNIENLYVMKTCKKIINASELINENSLDEYENCLVSNLIYMAKIIKNNLEQIFEDKEIDKLILYNEKIDLLLYNSFGASIIEKNRVDIFRDFEIYYALFESFINYLDACICDFSSRIFIGFNYCKKNRDDIDEAFKNNDEERFLKVEKNREHYKLCLQTRISLLSSNLAKEYAIKEIKESDDFNQKLKIENDKLNEIKGILSKLEDEVARASLIKDFEGFVKSMNKKLLIATITKWFSLILILIIPVSSLFFPYLFEINLTDLVLKDLSAILVLKGLSVIIIAVILGIMLRVAIRNQDQLQQILHKVGNKTAVIYYYNANKEKLDGDKKEIEVKFYDFLFKDIETSEWNSPDVSQSIIDIIKAVKFK